MRKYIFFYIGLFILAGCQEPYYPDITEAEDALVVDGMLCTSPGKSRVIVTNSGSFAKSVYNNPVNDLIIYALDTVGNRMDFIENGNSGIYVTVKDASGAAQLGNKYTLYIETPEGDTYKSTAQLVNECPVISKITIKWDKENILTEDSYGDILELSYEGLAIYSDTRGILPEDNYYLNKWYGYEEHRSTIGVPGTQSSDIYKHIPISSAYTRVVCTGNADENYNKELKNHKFVFIPEFTYRSYVPPVPSGYVVYSDLFQGYIFVSNQYSLSQDAYVFWKGAQDQLEASGKLFGPVSSQLKSNLTCVNKPDKAIFGVFYATDIKTRYDYLYISSKNRTYTKELDSLPELWIDTCSWRLPAGWIFPPF